MEDHEDRHASYYCETLDRGGGRLIKKRAQGRIVYLPLYFSLLHLKRGIRVTPAPVKPPQLHSGSCGDIRT